MIELRGVFKKWTHTVLDNVDLRINKGDFLYIVGDSGQGKTTLLKLLYGEILADRGQVTLNGHDLARISAGQMQSTRRKMGVIYQDLKLIEALSAYDNVALSLEIAAISRPELNRGGYKRAIDESLQLVSLTKISDKKVKFLSGGERQRVAAARAIVRQPELVIADEPMGGLDREQTWALMDLFQKIHLRGTTVIIATHDREIVRRVRKRSCILQGGRIRIEEGLSLF